jgi:hypothetical protein
MNRSSFACRAACAVLAAVALAAMLSSARADLVTTSPDLPPAGVYVSPADVHTTYSGPDLEVVLQRVEHRPFTDPVGRDTIGPDEIENFDSSMQGPALVTVPSMGITNMPATLNATGPVRTIVYGKVGNTTGTFDTEMLSMSLTGLSPLGPYMIRESPTLASLGRTSITDIGGGQYRIGSFFDVFTELSVDGGATWIPSAGPTRVDLVPEPGTVVLLAVAAFVLGAGAWLRRPRRRAR